MCRVAFFVYRVDALIKPSTGHAAWIKGKTKNIHTSHQRPDVMWDWFSSGLSVVINRLSVVMLIKVSPLDRLADQGPGGRCGASAGDARGPALN